MIDRTAYLYINHEPREIEPLINGLVNPIATYWLRESSLFKQLNAFATTNPTNTTTLISNHAVARYLYLQVELVESVFMPINDTIVECIKISSININSTLLNSMMKFFKSTSVEYLTATFTVEKARYWLGVLIKLKKMLFDASSPYYQVTIAVSYSICTILIARS